MGGRTTLFGVSNIGGASGVLFTIGFGGVILSSVVLIVGDTGSTGNVEN